MYAAWVRESFSSLWTVLQNPFILTLAVIVSTVALSLLINRWNRHRATVDLACRWNDGEVETIRAKFRKIVPWEANVRYTRESMEKLAENREVRAHLVTLLNHLDIAATGWYHKLFEEDAFTHLYGGLIRDFYCKYGEFIWRTYQLSIGLKDEDCTSIAEAGPGHPNWPAQRRQRGGGPGPSMRGTYAYLLVKGQELSKDWMDRMQPKNLELQPSG